MRVAYLTEWPPYVESGVLRKMLGQVSAWREAGHETRIFTLAPLQDRPTAPGFAGHGEVIGTFNQTQLERFPRARLGFLNKIVSASKLRRALQAFKPDIIYYRQNGPWYPGLDGILRAWRSVAEINTFEGAENALWGGTFSRFQAATRRRVLRAVDGFVCVTQEIADHEAWAGKPAAIIGNSFWGDPETDPAPTGNRHPAFVITASPMTLAVSDNWNGTDKIFPLAAAMPDSIFHVAGMTAADFPGLIAPSNVRFHGMVPQDQLAPLYRTCDIAFGTLAFHRKAMEEGCPLKVRDYLMHRMAIVIGYREAQDELNDAPYVLRIPNSEDNVTANIDRIAAFAREWTNKRVTADLGFLTGKAIETRRLEFLSRIAEK